MHEPIRTTLAALLVGALSLACAPSWAQGGNSGQDQQAANDQQVDLALGTLDTRLPLRLLMLPPQRIGTHGPLPFDQQPPAAQSDFSDVTVTVNPRGSFGGKP